METGLENTRYPAFAFTHIHDWEELLQVCMAFQGNGVLRCIEAEYIGLEEVLRNADEAARQRRRPRVEWWL